MEITIATGIFWPEMGGPATYVKMIAQEMTKNGFKVNVVCRSKKRKYKEDKELPFPIYRIKNLRPKIASYFFYFLKLIKVARKSDVIFCQGPVSSGLPAYWANKFLKKKFVLKIVGDYAWEQAALNKYEDDIVSFQSRKFSGKIGTLKKIQRRVAQSANLVIVPSEFLAKIVGFWGVKKENIKVINNGTDFEPLDISREEARKKIKISGNILLSIGRMVPWKGFVMLIKIMPELLRDIPFLRLVIIGDGPDFESLKRIVKNLNLENKVYILEKMSKENLRLYLAAADMFVLNSGYEGFSHQIIEVMACKIPVLVSTSGGNPEIVKSGENGLLFPYNNEFYLKEFIRLIHNDKELAENISQGALETSKNFTVKKTLEKTISALGSL